MASNKSRISVHTHLPPTVSAVSDPPFFLLEIQMATQPPGGIHKVTNDSVILYYGTVAFYYGNEGFFT
jgi:hypothetical protein